MMATTQTESQPISETRGPRPRVLVVDHAKLIRDIFVLVLPRDGFDCREAEDAQAAIDLLATGLRIDLVVSNFMFPIVDGLSLPLHCKKHHPRIPFAFLSSSDDAESAIRAARDGADGYLELPCEVAEFRKMVRGLVGTNAF